MATSGNRRVNAEETHDVVDAEIRLEVGVWLTPADRRNRDRAHVGVGIVAREQVDVRDLGAGIVWARGRRADARCGEKRMRVRRDLVHRQGDFLRSACLGQDEAIPLVYWNP